MDAAIFGLIVADVIAEPVDLRHPPATGGLAQINSVTLTTGGNVCNVAMAMAKLGMQVAGAGLVGKDILGSAIVSWLKDAGVDTSSIFPIDNGHTSSTIAAVDADGERTFFHAPGVTPQLDAAMFRKCFPLFKQCPYLEIGYFGLLPGLTKDLPDLLVELHREAPDTKIALDTVMPPGVRKLLDPILRYVDIFAPSFPEAKKLTGESEPDKMVASFRKAMKSGLIGIKMGPDGCYLDEGDQYGHTAVTAPAAECKVVDTTGAGDTWFAGLLTAMIKGMTLLEAGRFANRVAADCCSAFGASAGVRSFDETLARM